VEPPPEIPVPAPRTGKRQVPEAAGLGPVGDLVGQGMKSGGLPDRILFGGGHPRLERLCPVLRAREELDAAGAIAQAQRHPIGDRGGSLQGYLTTGKHACELRRGPVKERVFYAGHAGLSPC
jgi:hypothetical protein